MPDPRDLLAVPAERSIADLDRPDRTMLVAKGVVDAALSDGSTEIVEAVWHLLCTAIDAGHGDVCS